MTWGMRTWSYIKYLARHKWFVFYAGMLVDAPLWRLLIHDWSKLTPLEWIAYRDFFYGTRTIDVKIKFERAWLAHIHRNKHHWDHWCTKDGKSWKAIPMPDKYVREMVADWAGAGRAIHGKWELREWYTKNQANMLMHPVTRIAVEQYLKALEHYFLEDQNGESA